MPGWLWVALAAPSMIFGGNLGTVLLIAAVANQPETKQRPPRGGKRIPLPLPAGA